MAHKDDLFGSVFEAVVDRWQCAGNSLSVRYFQSTSSVLFERDIEVDSHKDSCVLDQVRALVNSKFAG